MQNRAYSILNVKELDADKRIIRGMATTPATDRVGDSIDPLGVEFNNPSPLLWMHQTDLPVGTVRFGKPTKDGVPFEATIANIPEPAGLKARVDEAWASVKAGLVSAVSVGFRAIEWSVNETTGGLNFLKTEILELSLVCVPANREATITSIKSYDSEILAALGTKRIEEAKDPTPSGATEKPYKTAKLTPKEGTKMNIAEQIKSYQNERAAKAATMEDIMGKSEKAGETLDKADSEAFDTLSGEVKAIDEQLSRLSILQSAKAYTATLVTEKAGGGEKAADDIRQFNRVSVQTKKAPGVAMAQVIKCLGIAKGNAMQAVQIAGKFYPDDARIQNVIKAAVAAGTTSNADWAGNLVGEETSVYADFVEFLRPQTIIGKFGTGNIPSLRRVPFRVPLIGQSTGGAAYWTAEGAAKGLTKFDFTRATLEPLKVANIAVLTEELLRDSSPSADMLVRDQLAAALRERLDIDFVDPTKAASAGVSPASITNGVTPVASSGSTAENVRCDIGALFGDFIAANNAPTTAVLVMSATTALNLSLMRNPLGQREFVGVNMMNGGELDGIPVIVSEYVPTLSDGTSYIFMVNASDIYLGDDGGLSVDMSREASLQMDSAPSMKSDGTPTATSVVSMFQTNSVAFRAERTINWAKRRVSAVSVLDGVNYSQCS